MIPSETLEPWNGIASRLGLKPWRHGRGACPFCESHTGFSCHEKKGFNCFACGEHGDKIRFIEKFCSTDFKGSLAYFGLDTSTPRAPDPEMTKQRKADALQWARLLMRERELREEFRVRSLIAFYGGERLRDDSDSDMGWKLLEIAYAGRPLSAIENDLDHLQEMIPREAYPRSEDLPGYELLQAIRRAAR